MNKPLISVIVPIYNVEEYLDKCVKSIISQTYNNLEIILVDDGSPDKSPQMCDVWAQKDNRIKVVHKSNGGLSSARNAGIAVSNGDYIGFVDSDDYIAPEMYEKLFKVFGIHQNVGIAACMIQGVSNNKLIPFNEKWQTKIKRVINSDDFAIGMQEGKYAHTVWNKLYKRDVVLSTRFREGMNNEDMLFMFDIRTCIESKAYSMVEIPDFLYFYLHRDGSICNSVKTPLAIQKIENLLRMRNECKENEKELSKVLYIEYYKTLYGFVDSLSYNKIWKDNYWVRYRKLLKEFPNYIIQKEFGVMGILNYYILLYCPLLRKYIKEIKM